MREDDFTLPEMGSKAKLGNKASKANQYGAYDKITVDKEKEIADRTVYLSTIPDSFNGFRELGDLPPLITDEVKLIESLNNASVR